LLRLSVPRAVVPILLEPLIASFCHAYPEVEVEIAASKELIDLAAERERLGKEIAKTEAELVTVRKKLANESFVANAPAAVVAEHREREKKFADRLAQLEQMVASLG